MDRAEALKWLKLSEAEAADTATLRRAYRNRVREVHPDLNSREDATELTLSITRAYQLLLDQPVIEESAAAEGHPGLERYPSLALQVVDESSILVFADRETTFSAVLSASQALGEVGYLDRSAWLVELIVEFVEAPTSSVVMTLQGRSAGTEVFCTVEPLSGGSSPPIAPVTDLLARTLSEVRQPPIHRDG